MTDIRTRLEEALRKHYLWDECNDETSHIARCRCDVDNPSITNGVPDGGWMPFDDYFAHVADVLLSLPSIAIVDTEILKQLADNARASSQGEHVSALGQTYFLGKAAAYHDVLAAAAAADGSGVSE